MPDRTGFPQTIPRSALQSKSQTASDPLDHAGLQTPRLLHSTAETDERDNSNSTASPSPQGRRPACEQTQTIAAWTSENAQQIADYNAWAIQREPYSQRVRRWRRDGQY